MNGIPFDLHYADVIDNNDPDKKGRIKIKIPYLHEGLSNDLLPYATQFLIGGGGSNDYGKSFIPENNSKVWIGFYDKEDMKLPFYIADIQLSEIHPHNLFEDNVKSEIESSSSYPNTKYTYYKNGICIGVDSSDSNAEIFVYHPSGSYFKIDNSGKSYLKTGTGTFEKMLKGETFKTMLDNILTAIQAITVTDPQSSSLLPINNVAQFALIQAQIDTILSPNSFND